MGHRLPILAMIHWRSVRDAYLREGPAQDGPSKKTPGPMAHDLDLFGAQSKGHYYH